MNEVLEYHNLTQYTIIDDFNYLYVVPFNGGQACLKVYAGTKFKLHYLNGTVARVLSGFSSYMPKARRRRELECLKLWRSAGFRVFGWYENVEVKGLPKDCYTMLEYCSAELMTRYLGRAEIPLTAKLDKYRKFLRDWYKRHKLALETSNPLLTHNNGGIKHVMLLPNDEFLYFDFEVTIRSRNPQKIRHAIVNEVIKHLKFTALYGVTLWPQLLQATVEHYPERKLLEEAVAVMFNPPNHLLRLFRACQRKSKKALRPFSKYRVIADLARALDYPSPQALGFPGVITAQPLQKENND